MPGLFVILQLTACLSEAFHSFPLTIRWPFEGFATLRAKSPGPRFSEAGNPLNCIAQIPASPFAFSKERTSFYNSKGSELEVARKLGSEVSGVAHPSSIISPLITSILDSRAQDSGLS